MARTIADDKDLWRIVSTDLRMGTKVRRKRRCRSGGWQRQEQAGEWNDRSRETSCAKQAASSTDQRQGDGDCSVKKIERIGEVGCLSGVRQEKKHLAVRSVHEEKHYSVNRLCDILNLNRSSYYKWLRRKESQVETENRRIIEWVKELYEEQNGILGYRQMTITINRDKNTQYNVKRIRRLMRYLRLKVCLPQKTGKLYSVHTGNNSRKHFESWILRRQTQWKVADRCHSV